MFSFENIVQFLVKESEKKNLRLNKCNNLIFLELIKIITEKIFNKII